MFFFTCLYTTMNKREKDAVIQILKLLLTKKRGAGIGSSKMIYSNDPEENKKQHNLHKELKKIEKDLAHVSHLIDTFDVTQEHGYILHGYMRKQDRLTRERNSKLATIAQGVEQQQAITPR